MIGRAGPYQLLRLMATGGMAEVFLARRARRRGRFDKLVAVKLMRAEQAADARLRAMFEAEASLGARLQHPNLVAVVDAGTHRGRPFLVMERVDGRDLRDVLERARQRGVRVPAEVALAIVAAVAGGLHHAHELADEHGRSLGVVHRDVSADNVLVGFDGGVRLADFGIAKGPPELPATEAGVVKGKRGAMSPEQCAGQSVDRRSDVFSLGLLLYELTTGLSPFPDESEAGVVRALLETGIPAPGTRVPGYPAPLEAIVVRALARAPAARFATARELQVELENLAAASGTPLSMVDVAAFMESLYPAGERAPAWRPAPAPARARGAVALAALAGVALLAVVTVGVRTAPRAPVVAACAGGAARFVWPETRACYTRHDEALTWDAAAGACAREGGHLVTYQNGYEHLAVYDHLLAGASGWYWIGLRRGPDGAFGWQTVDAGPGSLAWGPGEPGAGACAQQSASPQVAQFDRRGPWRAFACDTAARFVCETPAAEVRPASGHVYRLLGHPRAFDDAQAACAALGGHLATPTDADEDAFVRMRFPGRRWLGARVTGADVSWITGERSSHRAFAVGEPDGKPPERRPFCLALDTDGSWHDRPCADRYPAICESDR